MNYAQLLKEKGFSLNDYPDGKYYVLVADTDEHYDEGQHILKVFEFEDEYPDTVILQCKEDFTKCSLYTGYVLDFDTEEFMKLVEKL